MNTYWRRSQGASGNQSVWLRTFNGRVPTLGVAIDPSSGRQHRNSINTGTGVRGSLGQAGAAQLWVNPVMSGNRILLVTEEGEHRYAAPGSPIRPDESVAVQSQFHVPEASVSADLARLAQSTSYGVQLGTAETGRFFIPANLATRMPQRQIERIEANYPALRAGQDAIARLERLIQSHAPGDAWWQDANVQGLMAPNVLLIQGAQAQAAEMGTIQGAEQIRLDSLTGLSDVLDNAPYQRSVDRALGTLEGVRGTIASAMATLPGSNNVRRMPTQTETAEDHQ